MDCCPQITTVLITDFNIACSSVILSWRALSRICLIGFLLFSITFLNCSIVTIEVRDKNMGLLAQFSTTFTSYSSAHNSHIAPELISLLNCIKLWGKLVLVLKYGVNLTFTLVLCIATTKANLPRTIYPQLIIAN